MSKLLFLYFRKHFCLVWTVEEIQQSNQNPSPSSIIKWLQCNPDSVWGCFAVMWTVADIQLVMSKHFNLYFRKHIAQMWTAAYSHQIRQGILTGYWIWWPYCMCATAALFIFILHYGIFSAPFRCWMTSVWLRLVASASEQKSDSNS